MLGAGLESVAEQELLNRMCRVIEHPTPDSGGLKSRPVDLPPRGADRELGADAMNRSSLW